MTTKDKKLNQESLDVLLQTSKNEYENEHSRTSIIDNKTSIALPIMSAYFLALIPQNNLKQLFSVQLNTFFDFLLPSCLLLLYISSLVLAFLAVINIINVVMTKDYIAIDPYALYDEDYLFNDKKYIVIKLISLYIEASLSNKEVNDSRIPKYKKSWKFVIISICLFMAYMLMFNIL